MLLLLNEHGDPSFLFQNSSSYNINNWQSLRKSQCRFYFSGITLTGNSLVLHCVNLLRTIFASSARAHERVHVQNVRDFPETKLDNGINSPFLLNKHGDPRFFIQVFAKNSLMKDIFEEEKSLIVEHDFFLENGAQLGVFWPRRGLQVNHGTVRKSAILLQPGNQERLK